MFRPVVAIIRSLSFDIFKIILYNCAAACLMWRSQHQDPCLTSMLSSILFDFLCVYSYFISLFFWGVSDIIDSYLFILLRGSPTHLI